MNYKIVRLGTDYEGKIDDFSKARNSFIERLKDDEWILFLDNDASAPPMLLGYLRAFNPPRDAKYYAIRVINLFNCRYIPQINPFFWRILVSNKVRYVGKLHEKILDKPTGLIDIPVVHNHIGQDRYSQNKFFHSRAFSLWLAGKKVKDILLRGHYDRWVID